jgi:hypothetical protein
MTPCTVHRRSPQSSSWFTGSSPRHPRVARQSKKGIEIGELIKGRHDAAFSYLVTAVRAGKEAAMKARTLCLVLVISLISPYAMFFRLFPGRTEPRFKRV